MQREKELVSLLKDFIPPENKEIKQRLIVVEAAFDGLLNAYKGHKRLGEDGKKKDAPNQFGDLALRADIEAERKIRQAFKKWADKDEVLVIYRGEELGRDELGYLPGEKYFVVFDGLDGSDNFLKDTQWPYGTMVAVAKGEDPIYEDFEVAGITMHEEGWIVLGIKGVGVFVVDVKKKKLIKLPRFKDEDYDSGKILADDYFPEAQELLGEKREIWSRTGSTAATIVAIAAGRIMKDREYPGMNEGWQALVDVTRKGNLEQPVLYRIISELGGVMVDRQGRSIGGKKFIQWGQEEKVPVITASSTKVLAGVIADLGLSS